MKRVLLLFMSILILSCSTDDVQERAVNESYTLVYTTGELPVSVSVYAGTRIDYNNSFEFVDSQYDDVANTITVETDLNPIKIESNFYIENGSEVSIILYDSGGTVIDEQTIAEVDYTYIYEF